MRITGGALRGRPILAPPGPQTRPMLERFRKSLFDVIASRDWGEGVASSFEGADVLDAFCGSGALAFEALSRGAARACLFDLSENAVRTAKENAASLGVGGSCDVRRADATRPPRPDRACGLVFVAPPYHTDLGPPALKALHAAGWIAQDALVVVHTAPDEPFEFPPGFELLHARDYGDTRFRFARVVAA